MKREQKIFNLHLPMDLYKTIKKLSQINGLSVTREIILLLDYGIVVSNVKNRIDNLPF